MNGALRPVLDWPVWLLVAASLLTGSFIRQAEAGRLSTARVGATRLAYPAAWAPQAGADPNTFVAADLTAGAFGDRVELRRLKPTELMSVNQADQADVMSALSAWSLTRGQRMTGFRILGQTPTTALGRPAARLDYAYLADPPGGLLTGALPVVLRASDTLVRARDGSYVMTVAGRAEENATRLDDQRSRLLAAWEQP
ncbi:hypothetical protein LAJ19_15025 (plasmid) [Deinococcus taeanensis]|uniref:hypothetical protein n=1 Tax=Deinococcus taeanensis TaxID=2737050 RepID=UPI001CDBD29F|nr:hypothetical protein [Deinococcus taeanensis]UBV44118.1 hypothetical protein LAJ19_15025 [Deinococcus taeanensis]